MRIKTDQCAVIAKEIKNVTEKLVILFSNINEIVNVIILL